MHRNTQTLDAILREFDAWAVAPFEEAVQIPSALYTSADVATHEIERVFR